MSRAPPSTPRSVADSRGPSAFRGRQAPGLARNLTRVGRDPCLGGSRAPEASHPGLPELASKSTNGLVKFDRTILGASHEILGKVRGRRPPACRKTLSFRTALQPESYLLLSYSPIIRFTALPGQGQPMTVSFPFQPQESFIQIICFPLGC